jgi:hypothetical protein
MKRTSIEGVVLPRLLRWPEEAATAEALASRGLPRLLLVDADSDPPMCVDPLEDWVRLPIVDRDLDARLNALRERARLWFPSAGVPRFDGSGRLLRANTWVALSPIEERITKVLLDRFGDVTSDEEILAGGWPEGDGTALSLRVHLARLRRRIAPLGLEILSVRSKGHVLQSVSDCKPVS